MTEIHIIETNRARSYCFRGVRLGQEIAQVKIAIELMPQNFGNSCRQMPALRQMIGRNQRGGFQPVRAGDPPQGFAWTHRMGGALKGWQRLADRAGRFKRGGGAAGDQQQPAEESDQRPAIHG